MTSARVKSDELDNLISQVEAARIRSVSKQAIADLIRRGRLSSVKVAGHTLVLRSEVENFVPQPKLGRPPKKSVPAKTAPVKTAKKKAPRKKTASPSEGA